MPRKLRFQFSHFNSKEFVAGVKFETFLKLAFGFLIFLGKSTHMRKWEYYTYTY
jgi:hypothetical protein